MWEAKMFTQLDKHDWMLFSEDQSHYIGKRCICNIRPHPMMMPNDQRHGVISKLTKSNMIGAVLEGDKNITSFRYEDVFMSDLDLDTIGE